jgi:hypothetical protein
MALIIQIQQSILLLFANYTTNSLMYGVKLLGISLYSHALIALS